MRNQTSLEATMLCYNDSQQSTSRKFMMETNMGGTLTIHHSLKPHGGSFKGFTVFGVVCHSRATSARFCGWQHFIICQPLRPLTSLNLVGSVPFLSYSHSLISSCAALSLAPPHSDGAHVSTRRLSQDNFKCREAWSPTGSYPTFIKGCHQVPSMYAAARYVNS